MAEMCGTVPAFLMCFDHQPHNLNEIEAEERSQVKGKPC